MTPDQVAAIDHPPVGRGLLGEVITAHGPTLAAAISEDPRSIGFPEGHPRMTSFLGVPVASAVRRHGNLYVTDKRGAATFDEEDVRLVTALAGFCACAIDNALLVDAERARNTAADRAAAAERRSHLRREALERVIEAQESERARVARDLHDQIGQSLTSILLALRLVESADPTSTEQIDRIAELRELVTDTLDDVRRVAFDLRPAVLDDFGLRTALMRLASDLLARTGLEVEVTCTGIDDDHRLDPQTETMLYRIAQEALTNIVRHAVTPRAEVSLVRSSGQVRLQIADRGSGFDTAATGESLGLTGMAERADLIGAQFAIHSSVGSGTTVSVEVPVA
jgi:signal transduction histidine kinase